MIRYFIILLLFITTIFGQYRDIPEVVTKVATSTANWLRLDLSPCDRDGWCTCCLRARDCGHSI